MLERHLRYPVRLYRYTSIIDSERDQPLFDKMWFTKPLAYDDPYDGTLTFDEAMEALVKVDLEAEVRKLEEVKAENDKRKVEWVQDQEKFIKEVDYMRSLLRGMNRINTLSLSEDFKNIMMWNQYADHHAGVCLEYTVKELLKIGDFNDKSASRFSLEQIEYTRERLHLGNMQLDKNMIIDQKYLNRTMYRKFTEWSHEREWRLVYEQKEEEFEEGGVFGVDLWMPKPSHVYMGTHIARFEELNIIRYCEKNNIGYSKFKMNEDEFKLIDQEAKY